jgi:hypothetical protein
MLIPPVKPAWINLIHSLECSHVITLSPFIPGIVGDARFKLGESLARRLKDRASLKPGQIVLIPEQSPDGFCHYHGFVSCRTPYQRDFLDREAEELLEHAMRNQAELKYRVRYERDRLGCSALVERRGENIESAVLYATKLWDLQDKGSIAIFV